jgi:hypothetical protein
MREWLSEHGLSLFLCAIWFSLSTAAFVLTDKEWQEAVQEYLHNLAGDAFGATLIVMATKYLRERGSAESK